MPKFRSFTRHLFIFLNGLVVLLFLLACANGFLRPGKWWLISLLGLAFPYLFLFLACCLIGTLFVRSLRPWSLVSLVALLIGWSNIRHFLALHPGGRFQHERVSGATLRLLTWNVRSFDEFLTRKRPLLRHRPHMLDFIGSQDADILCLQEFYEPLTRHGSESNIDYIRDRLHYPYYYFSRDHVRPGLYEAGVVIFSRFPIIDSFLYSYPRPMGFRTTESLIATDILAGRDTIRVYTTHLQSVLFGSKEFRDIEIIKNVDDSIVDASRSIVRKLRDAFWARGQQAEQVRERLDSCRYPAFICGDFNDVPNSYTYATIRGNWRDAWLQKGFGIGRTYKNISPTLRIDYILTAPALDVLQCRKISVPWSDHNPVEADLELTAPGPR
ncbi:MAG TPA: endonuclease/exonuclease/phosphatase family protein [Puia sp.]|nr:endonuclease/exonuclease/phosphatase family protein [Puia sp.]